MSVAVGAGADTAAIGIGGAGDAVGACTVISAAGGVMLWWTDAAGGRGVCDGWDADACDEGIWDVAAGATTSAPDAAT
jgi:hypothetical protein